MRYISSSENEKNEMLESIGLKSIDDLFLSIPKQVRLKNQLNLPKGLSEPDLLKFFRDIANKNASTNQYSYFLGAGAYNHFIPVIIDPLISRAEFLTAYTPYQPEISQGTLQSIFEFQTLVCQLTGMEVANASMYDGSTAMAEAVLMACRIKQRSKVITFSNVHPEYRQVLELYTKNFNVTVVTLEHDIKTGRADLAQLKKELTADCAAVIIQSPNFFGSIEELEEINKIIHQCDAISITVIPEPISLGVLRPPGERGSDIVVAEGQSLGIPLSFGGPYLGLFASLDKFKRNMPGRIVGQAQDSEGNVGYVLTLATREQHIRREKATSNICTNEGLCALMATIYLCTLGKQGLREVASQNVQKAHYMARALLETGKCKLKFSAPYFNEFVVDLPLDATDFNERLRVKKIIGGFPLARFYPGMNRSTLLCVTEQNSKEEIDQFVSEVANLG